MAGSNHVLPTGGCAHYASGLGVHSFVRAVQLIEYDADALGVLRDRIVALAQDEDLPAHGEAVQARFGRRGAAGAGAPPDADPAVRFRVVTSLAPSRDLLARGAPAVDAMLDRMAQSSRMAQSLGERVLGSAAARSTWMTPTALLGMVGAVGLAATALLTGCGSGGERPNADAPATGPVTPGPGEYLPGLPASVDLPTGDPTVVVVLVPGGGWSSADPAGLAPLAAHLTDNGLAVVTITYGTSGTDAYYPRPCLL